MPDLTPKWICTVNWFAYSVAARHYFWLGDKDKGFEWLEKARSRNEYNLLNVGVEEDFDSIRDDPCYFDLLKRLGLD